MPFLKAEGLIPIKDRDTCPEFGALGKDNTTATIFKETNKGARCLHQEVYLLFNEAI